MTCRTGMAEPAHKSVLGASVPRRLAMVLAAWIGLLWAASPVLACGAGNHRDCCPPGASSPCSGVGSGVDLAIAALCCASAPSLPSAVATEVSRTTDVQRAPTTHQPRSRRLDGSTGSTIRPGAACRSQLTQTRHSLTCAPFVCGSRPHSTPGSTGLSDHDRQSRHGFRGASCRLGVRVHSRPS